MQITTLENTILQAADLRSLYNNFIATMEGRFVENLPFLLRQKYKNRLSFFVVYLVYLPFYSYIFPNFFVFCVKVGCKIHVSGIVQGVGFRYFVFKKARYLSLEGFAKNLVNGAVEIYAEGERSLVEELIALVKIGPPNAHVSGINVAWEEWKGTFSNFKIR